MKLSVSVMILLVLGMLCLNRADSSVGEPNWDNVKLLGQQLQSGIDKQNSDKTRYYAELIIKALPSLDTTYFMGLRTGQEISLVAGAAKSVVGSTAEVRVNQWTRAAGEYLSIDRHIPGLTLLITGEEVLNNLMEFGWSYRMHPNGHHPVYAATRSIPGKGGKYNGGRPYSDRYAAMYSDHVKDHMVAVHPHQADIVSMSKHQPINLVFADLTPRSVGGRVEHILVVKGHYTIQAGTTQHVWGDKNRCEECDPKYQVFQ